MEAPTTDVITISDKAARKIGALAQKEGRAEAILRVRVTAGGCSGFSYHLSFEDAPATDDQIVGHDGGVRVVIDPHSVPIVAGSTLDFDDAMMGGGLRMLNPQATHECACGDSFSI
jgi:iron-sulfur cluster assembly protein/NifU-like protein